MMFNLGQRRLTGQKKAGIEGERGQSLVEMAVIVPLLLFMFLGMVEVGWAIRGYLVLLTTNRETARFATRGEYLNFQGRNIPSEEVAERVGYNSVLTHTNNVLVSNRLGVGLVDNQGRDLLQPLEGASQGSFIISHYLIDTGYPCKIDLSDPNDQCATACANENYYEFDDDVVHPGLAGYEHFSYTRPATTTYTSRIDPFALAERLKKENNALNCTILKRRGQGAFANPEMSVNSVIVVEAFYDQPQILGFPFLSNAFTDPILLYTQTMMRVTSDKLPQGSRCDVVPIAIQRDALYNGPIDPNNPDVNRIAVGSLLDNLREGTGSGDFGWLRWRSDNSADRTLPATNSSGYLSETINNPRLSMYDYRNPASPSDTVLSVGDSILSFPGQNVAHDVEVALENRKNQVVTNPVWDSFDGTSYHVVGFSKMRITDIDFTGSQKTISGSFQGWDLDCFDPNQ
jgi:hypothetical protein